MRVIYDPSARLRFGLELDSVRLLNLSRETVESHLHDNGFTLKRIRDAIQLAKSEGIANAKARSVSVQAFINTRCYVVDGAMIPFRDFYARFLASLTKDDRYFWTPYRVARALPERHPSGAHTMNRKFVANLSWEPTTPTAPLIAVPGKKSQGRARVLVYK